MCFLTYRTPLFSWQVLFLLGLFAAFHENNRTEPELLPLWLIPGHINEPRALTSHPLGHHQSKAHQQDEMKPLLIDLKVLFFCVLKDAGVWNRILLQKPDVNRRMKRPFMSRFINLSYKCTALPSQPPRTLILFENVTDTFGGFLQPLRL